MSIDNFLLSSNTTDLNYPEIRPTLDLNFARVKALDPRITFTRASGGSYVGADGLIKLAGVNEPRFDHDLVTGESLGLLVEESRTNLHLYSEDLSNWTAETDATISSNAYLSPNGTQTADGINGTTDGSSAYIITTLSNATTYTFSVFLKYISGVTSIEIQIGDEPFSRSLTTFNVQTGTLLSNTGGTATVNSIQNYGNGWYRYSITRTTAASGGAFVDINHRTTTPSTVAVWGAQIEAGSFPTSYIPTVASTRTRAADVASITGKNFSSWYRQDEGTLYAKALNKSTAGIYIASINDSSKLNQSLTIYQPNSSQTALFSRTSSGVKAQITVTGAINAFNKFAGCYKTNDFAVSVNSETVGTDTSGAIPISTTFDIGAQRLGAADGMSGTITRLTYYPKRLTDAQLQTLTR